MNPPRTRRVLDPGPLPTPPVATHPKLAPREIFPDHHLGLVAVLAAYGNVAHTHSSMAMGSYAIFALSLVAMVVAELRGLTRGQEVATAGLLLGGAMSSLVSTNSFIFCFGIFFASLSALHLTDASGRVSSQEFLHAKRGFNTNSPRASPMARQAARAR